MSIPNDQNGRMITKDLRFGDLGLREGHTEKQ